MARPQAADYEQRKEAIVERSAKLFADHGFSAASISQIATACKTSKSLLYHYYPSKEDILYAVMASHIDQLVEDVDLVTTSDGSPADKLNRLLHAFMAHYVGAADRQKVLLNELNNLPAPKKAVIVRKQRSVVGAVQSLVVGMFPELADDQPRATALTMLLFGMINWTHTWFDPKGPIKAEEIADLAFALMSRGGPYPS